VKWIPAALLCLLLLGAACPAGAETRAEQADRVRAKAVVRVTESFDLPCPPEIVLASLQHQLAMAALWSSYMFTPAYQVSQAADAVHVVDPTGASGDLWTISTSPQRVVLLGVGTLDHWGIPGLKRGAAVFDIELAPQPPGTRMNVTVSLKPARWVAGVGLWLLAPIAHARIEKRMTHNVHDASQILQDISRDPSAVAQRLTGDVRKEFESAFAR
jgi:hypothetical protein